MPFPVKSALNTALIAAAFGMMSAANAAEVPTLDVSRTCKPIDGDRSMQIDTERCLRTEREAREQLAREWASFPAADRPLCTRTATMGGMASYVALITCLEMRRDAARLPGREMTTRPAGLPKK
jgi:hypothetical protein